MDRRLIYLVAAISLVAAALHPPSLPVSVSEGTRRAWAAAERLPPGSPVFLYIDYGFGAQEELDPMLESVVLHLMRRRAHLVLAARAVEGSEIARAVVERAAQRFPAYRQGYGTVWVNLGYRPAPDVTLRAATRNLLAAYNGVDATGQPLATMPVLRGVQRLDARHFGLAYVFDSSDAFVSLMYFVSQPTGLPFVVGAIAMEVPVVRPYLATGQIAAVIGGARGAAEYEQLIGRPARATRAQEAAAVAAAVVTALIAMGNVGALLARTGRSD